MNKKTILLAGAGALGLYMLLHKKPAPFVAQFTPLDANMSQDAFSKWQDAILKERDPQKLGAAADAFQAAGFPNSAAQLRLKEQAVLAGSA